MKTLLLILSLFLISERGNSQTRKPIDSFLGIKFGTDSATFKASILAKGGHFVPNLSRANSLAFNNITMGKRKLVILFANFVNNQFYQADVRFSNELSTSSIAYYNDLVKDINMIYGPGANQKKFTPPYYEGDGKETDAIKSKNAQYLYFWYDQAGNKMAANIDVSLAVQMMFQDIALLALTEKKN